MTARCTYGQRANEIRVSLGNVGSLAGMACAQANPVSDFEEGVVVNSTCDDGIRWSWGTVAALTSLETYALLRLRQDVFIMEQQCLYADADGRDLVAEHLLAWEGDALVACARLFLPGAEGEAVIGRVVVAPAWRGRRLGYALMRRAVERALRQHAARTVWLSAQAHLRRFYGELGFEVCGAGYLEDAIPHLPMRLSSARAGYNGPM